VSVLGNFVKVTELTVNNLPVCTQNLQEGWTHRRDVTNILEMMEARALPAVKNLPDLLFKNILQS